LFYNKVVFLLLKLIARIINEGKKPLRQNLGLMTCF
jgi:hypothetical protein